MKVHTFRILSRARQFHFESWFIEKLKIEEFPKKLVLARERIMKSEEYKLSI